ncbi:SDR family oxidoreductase [Tepidiforma flava]|uniref:SDR family oxidoreductase n=1 Tax=Tepidiforma flava TaxID=3004094 RepID=A0ABY7M935_9CHLR|nr:SDR family oxidoreductase [Tepidiforma flava]WBL37041.1 SDR family oxidoreductase [Tepidiforma flava]
MERFSLEGKTALITGGSRGIGYGIARAFIEAGARVVIAARSEGPLQEAAASLGVNCIGLRCDVGDPEDVAALIERAWALGPLDVLVNNAGISPYYKRVEAVSVAEFDQVMQVNLRGAYFASVEAAKRMFAAGRGGCIINVSSVAGIVPLERQGVYAAAKAGLHQLTKVMALEWADRGVRVNAIAPGWVETDLVDELFASRHGERLRADIPMGRLATPDDVAGAAVWLASEAASYVTGSIVVIDGGRQLR